ALAAAHPEARFVGVDLSGPHVASAKKLAREGGLENIGVLERDFSQLLHEDIGEFDYVVAHGVLSWVSPEKRAALIELASAKLRPGGLLFVSYNAMPGWASVEPLRQLLLFAGVGDTTLERAKRALEFARAMEAAGADYFARNPAASRMLDTMTAVGLPYVVHEYLHEHWIPMYFARVASEMAARDLHFAGVLPAHLNFRDTAISEAHERLLAQVTDRVTFESLKDYALGEFFRRDVYVKGKAERSAAVTNAYLEEVAWGTFAPAERTVKLPHRTVSLEGPLYDAILGALAKGATTFKGADDELRAALVRLIATDVIAPFRAPTHAPALR